MKGAQGLLISITGGRDMTLFEVDEAATRIREEVDPDANIILGATFDEALEGIIRVSVVATGIDRGAGAADPRPFEVKPVARPVVRSQAAASQPAPQPVYTAPAAVIAPQPVAQQPQPVAYQQPDPIAEQIRAAELQMERELEIAVSQPLVNEVEAPLPVHESFRPASRLFTPAAAEAVQQPVAIQPQPVAPQYAEPAPQPRMVAPQPEPAPVQVQQARVEPSLMAQVRAEAEAARMPKVEDFPPVVKAEIERRAGVAPTTHAEERGPMGLLKRLTSSLGRKEDEAPAEMTAGAPQAASQPRRALSPEASLYAPRRGNLDDQGRQVAQQPKSQESEEFDIPAFLRRQNN
jgi:cell division protein FtsZ